MITSETTFSIYRIRGRASSSGRKEAPSEDQEYDAIFPKKYTSSKDDVNYVFREEFQNLLDNSAMSKPYYYTFPDPPRGQGVKRKRSGYEEGSSCFGVKSQRKRRAVRYTAEISNQFVSSFLPILYYARESVHEALTIVE